MTHDELLTKIDSKDLYWFHHRLALRAVVELHKPCTGLAHDNSPALVDAPCICVTCFDETYPCPTIEAIEKELK